MKRINKEFVSVFILLFLILVVNVYYLHLKSGYFVDEGMTLFLANGNYNGAVTARSDRNLYDFLEEFVLKENLKDTANNVVIMLKELTSAGNYSEEGTVAWYDAARNLLQGQRVWMDGQELFEQLTASKGERFQYFQVLINQAMDVHPPFYYLLVHTMFSLFPGSYSDAYLFAINLVALLLTCIVLWKITRLFTDNLYFPIITVAVFGLSQGAVSSSLYFRMYAVFTFWAVLTIYIHFLLEKNEYKMSKKVSVFLVSTVIMGFYTHYYYIIFLFPVFLMTVAKMISNKQKSELTVYIKKMITSGIISLIIWPFSLYHILFSYRGTEAASNLASHGLLSRIRNYYEILKRAFFYNSDILFCVVLLMGGLIFAVELKRSGVKRIVGTPIVKIMLISLFYLLVISQIAPTQSDRYIMCIYPFVALVIATIVTKLTDRLTKGSRIQKLIFAAIVGIIFSSSLWLITPNYLYLEQRDNRLGTREDPSHMNCLMVTDDDWRGFSEALDLSRYQQVIVLEEQELSLLEKEKPDKSDCDMVVYILGGLEQNRNLSEICLLLGYPIGSGETITSDIEDFNAYLVKGR